MRWLTRLLAALSPTCRQATRRQSEALDRPLAPSERLGLRLHLLLCKWCRRYGRQLKVLRSAARQCDDLETHEGLPRLSPEARDRIKDALRSGRE
jgi:hypothetical protein